ncbi:hypothetical protein GC105_14380 [Alkalibaculum sp. M08DMB]|uniref:D-glucuronyl C5-epimerase C-terminal domain-containing protein n=1 Tax=Alkalibaculum sporogenes TaxID=2655001 RepID=A0A6A7KBS2_9FIRM|nr:D-glucuronyl C5-epimerase family protein [Alkalibaculum sporogenes]MPW26968.1 hypothetical protein [Alkalibaculum sporogenes]
MYYKKKISKVLIAILITCFITQNINFTQILAQETTPIMGESQASKEQMVQYYTENSDVTYPQEFLDKNIDLEKFVGLIYDEAVVEGVRADVAIAQIIVNTNWLKFDGKVSINNNNFGSLKNLDGIYETFNFIQEGIRANIQHLKAHASTEPLNKECVDPEYDLIEPKGLSPNVEDLENEDSEYSNKIVNILQQIIGTQITLSTDNELYEDSNSTNEEKNSTEEEDSILENTEQKSSIATITTTEVQSSETTDKTIEVTVDVLNIDGTGYTGNTHTIRSSGTSENGVLYQFWVKDLSTNKWTMIQDYSKSSARWTPTKPGKYLYGVHIKDEKSGEKLDAHLYKEITIKKIEVTVDVLNIDGTGYTGSSHIIRSSGTSENGVLYQFWVKDLSSNKWTMIQDYSKSSARWTPTKPGKYLYGVHIKDEKSEKSLDVHLYKEIIIKPIEVKVDVLNIDGTGNIEGTHIIRSSGTSENGVLYQFWVKDLSTSKWTMIQDYSKSSARWTPTKPGKYLYGVHIKDEKSGERLDAHLYNEITIKQIEVDVLNIEGPKLVRGTHIIRAGAKSTNGVLYQFWVKDLSTNKWTMIQDYSKSSARWTPTKPGKYLYGVHIKDEKSEKSLDVHLYKEITIEAAIVNSLLLKGPGYSGSSYVLEATGSSENGVLYQFWINDLSENRWVEVQGYSEKNTYNWILEKEGQYKVGVHIKDKKSNLRVDAHLYKDIKINLATVNSLEIVGSGYTESPLKISAEGSSKNGVLYQFWIQDLSNNEKTIIQAYSEINNVSWTPEGVSKNYLYGVDIKDIKSKETDVSQYKTINLMQIKDYSINNLDYNELPYVNEEIISLDEINYNVDEEGIPIYKGSDGEPYYHPVVISQRIFPLIDGYVKTNDSEYLERAELFANKLYDLGLKIDEKVFFPYTFDFALHGHQENTMKAPWYSGMAQGQALTVFSRLYNVTGNELYLQKAQETFNTFEPTYEVTQNPWVVLIDEEGYLWIEEYPHDGGTQALNGFIFAIYGVYDYYMITNDEKAKEILQASINTIEEYIEDYRNEGEISYYCLDHKVKSDRYHMIHIEQLEMLYKFTGENYFNEMSNNFKSDYSK